MELTIDEIYKITVASLKEKENWEWKESYGSMPYSIRNEEIGINIRIFSPFSIDLELIRNIEYKVSKLKGRPGIIMPRNKRLPKINIFKQIKIYFLIKKIVKQEESKFKVNIKDKSLIRDFKLKNLLK